MLNWTLCKHKSFWKLWFHRFPSVTVRSATKHARPRRRLHSIWRPTDWTNEWRLSEWLRKNTNDDRWSPNFEGFVRWLIGLRSSRHRINNFILFWTFWSIIRNVFFYNMVFFNIKLPAYKINSINTFPCNDNSLSIVLQWK